MAVPPIQRSQQPAAADSAGSTEAARFAWLPDVVLGLLIVAALPLAIVSIPNTVSVVGNLLPVDIDKLGLIRAHGLALPAMMLTVPLAAVAVRRTKAAPVMVGGLALLAVADAAGGYAGSAFLVGLLRVLHGVGAGLLIPATLVAAWDRTPVLRALWAGMLAVSLLAAQAMALWPLDNVTAWQITLQPYPVLSGVSLGLAAVYLALWLTRGSPGVPGPEPVERSRLALSAVPAAGIAILAVGTTYNWPEHMVVLAALLSVVALLALASIGTFEGPSGRSLAYAMVAVGVVLLPTAAQITNVELGGLGGPGLSGLWAPFLISGVGAVLAAVVVSRLDPAAMQLLSGAGLVAIVLGMCAVRLMVPVAQGLLLVVPFLLLAVGAAVALTAALRVAGIGASLFGLSLCFPGVLGGYLLGTGVQVSWLRRATSPQELVDAFVSALHLWALIGGFLVVAVIVLAAVLARRSAGRTALADLAAGTAGAGGGEERHGGTGEASWSVAARSPGVAGSDAAAGREKGAEGPERARRLAGREDKLVGGQGESTGPMPVVPQPAQSPEDSAAP